MLAERMDVLALADGRLSVNLISTERSAGSHLSMLAATGKPLDVEIKPHREKRSITSNGALWLLMGRIANAIDSRPDEVYLEMLKKYSHKFTHIIAKADAVEEIKEQWRTVVELGPLEVNDSDGVQLRCYFGSSTMNSKQFSTLLTGVISECKELGLETLRDGQFDRIMEQYEKEA